LKGGEDSGLGENAGEDLTKEVVLHLKRYDTAPLNCTVTFMAQKMRRPPEQIYKAIQELAGDGVVGSWIEWQKGALTPYKIVNLPKLIDKGTQFTYEEIELLTSSHGGCPEDGAWKVRDVNIGAPWKGYSDWKGKHFISSQWAKENLMEMSRRFTYLHLGDKVGPKRPSLRSAVTDSRYRESLVHDYELGYLNIFFRSIFSQEDIDPMYALYASEDEDLTAFRRRTLQALLESLTEISKSLLEKLEPVGPDKGRSEDRYLAVPYLYFFASMIDRCVRLSKEVGVQTKETEKLVGLRAKILERAGEGKL